MAQINANYLDLPGSYLFSEVAARVAAYTAANPAKKLIRLGIGDVTSPLTPSVLAALHEAVAEQGSKRGFRGYGPEQGYDFLREAVVESAYTGLGIEIDEIFISDGAKCDLGNFQELFSTNSRVAVTDPVYPVYVDSNVMAGRGGKYVGESFDRIIYLPCTAENGFVPALPDAHTGKPNLIYLCYPNNPTGTVLTREQLAQWVEYAQQNKAVIFFDAAYEAFITSPHIPHSIYEIEGAREVAVEFRSYSKTAGFTGLRCGFTVVPKSVRGITPDGRETALRDLWLRRQTTKYNGCPYIVQRAAAATHTAQGQAEIKAVLQGYLDNAKLIRDTFINLGFTVAGGEKRGRPQNELGTTVKGNYAKTNGNNGDINAPYVWLKTPEDMDSWSFFDMLLRKAGVVGTPGAGFGPSGEGYFRLTGFGDPVDTREGLERIKDCL